MKRLLLALLLTGAVTAKAQTAAFDYNEMDCGPELTTFRCLAPAQAKSVVVRLYQDAEGGKALKTVKMKKTADTDDNGCAVWQTAVKGNLLGRYYTFDSGEGETAGVFAKAVGTKGQRAAIVNMVNTFPDDWRTIVVILNGTQERQTVSLPKGMYTIVCQDGEINEASTNKLFGRRVAVSPTSALILHE